jgi:hypothetical protein
LNKWLASFKNNDLPIGKLIFNSNDFQHQARIRFVHFNETVLGGDGKFLISPSNLIISGIYLTLRQCIEASWINDRDQFLYPNDGWQSDTEFQNDCLAYTLFHGQNRITNSQGINHWIPFTEQEVNAKEKFDSHFMSDFIQGKIKKTVNQNLFESQEQRHKPLEFSLAAQAVFQAGKELWTYYQAQKNANVNAAFYDIRAYFQGRNENGKMNHKSKDEIYTKIMINLRAQLEKLGAKIEPKIYEYEFLKR